MTLSARFVPILIFTIFCYQTFAQKKVEILTVPAGEQVTKINIGGTTILPSGRFLTPAGDLLRITDDPFGMAFQQQPDI